MLDSCLRCGGVPMALETRPSGIVQFGTFEADLRSGELRKQGKRIKIQEQPFQVLTVLLQHPGEIVTREEFRNQNWPPDTFVDFDNSLNTAINKLRDALGDSANSPRFIETLPRRGYRFIGSIQTESSAQLAPGPASPQTPPAELPQPGPKPRSHRKVWFLAGALACAG